jgi:hypothetical protein
MGVFSPCCDAHFARISKDIDFRPEEGTSGVIYSGVPGWNRSEAESYVL